MTARPRNRDAFHVAVICALPLEFDAVHDSLDESWDQPGQSFGKAPGDPNLYVHGRIGGHPAVLTLLAGMGTSTAASAAASMRSSYPHLRLAFVVGVCGAVPEDSRTRSDISFGDVIISKYVVQYDFGRQNEDEFVRKTAVEDTLGRPTKEIRILNQFLETRVGCEQIERRTEEAVGSLRTKLEQTKHRGVYDAPEPTSRQPAIHVGGFASGNAVIKSATHRDRIAARDRVIGFEMEGAGVWDEMSSLIVKGVCDLADVNKQKEWQKYAAATAASAAKVLLSYLGNNASEGEPIG